MKTLTCGIIGAGPLGFALAQRLTKSGVRVGVFSRSGAMAIEKSVDGERLAVAACDLKDCTVVLSAVPAYAAAAAFTAHAPSLTKGTPWISLSNGMIWDELVRLGRRFPTVVPRAGLAQFGATELNGEIRTTGATDVRWGPLFPSRLTSGEEALARLPGWTWDENVKERLVQKWVYNSVLNSLCAARRWGANGEALRHWSLVAALVGEAVALARELWGVVFEAAQVTAGLRALVEHTAANENSMVRAIRRGARTEHAALLGWVHQAKGEYAGLRQLAAELETQFNPPSSPTPP